MHPSTLFAASAAVLLASQALAGMMGAQISASFEAPRGSVGSDFSFTTTVTNDVEHHIRPFGPTYPDFGMDIDIKDTSIRITFFVDPGGAVGWIGQNSPNFFLGYVIRDVNHTISDFTGISIGDQSPGMPYHSPSGFFGPPWLGQVSVEDADTLVINLAGLAGGSNEYIEVNVATVPAPGAAMLLGVAGAFARRRR